MIAVPLAIGATWYLTRPVKNCLVLGSLVSTPAGLVRVEDLQLGDSVTCLSPIGELKPGRVVAKSHARRKSYFEVSFSSSPRPLRITGEHPIATPNGWQAVEELSVGDLVYAQLGVRRVSAISEIAEESDVYDLSVSPHPVFLAEGIVTHNKTPKDPLPKDVIGFWSGFTDSGEFYRVRFDSGKTGVCTVTAGGSTTVWQVARWSSLSDGFGFTCIHKNGQGFNFSGAGGPSILSTGRIELKWRQKSLTLFRESRFLDQLENAKQIMERNAGQETQRTSPDAVEEE